MLNEEKKEKIKKFFQALQKVQPTFGKDIGLIVIKEESIADVCSLYPESNLVSLYELTEEMNITNLIEKIGKDFNQKRTVFLRIYDYLDPKLYNQLYLISKAGKMDFFKLEKDFLINVPKESNIVLITTSEELENLNYKDLFNVIGPVLRLE